MCTWKSSHLYSPHTHILPHIQTYIIYTCSPTQTCSSLHVHTQALPLTLGVHTGTDNSHSHGHPCSPLSHDSHQSTDLQASQSPPAAPKGSDPLATTCTLAEPRPNQAPALGALPRPSRACAQGSRTSHTQVSPCPHVPAQATARALLPPSDSPPASESALSAVS